MGRDKEKKPATYEDIEALPVGWVGELIEDELVASPRPATKHLRVASRLGALLALPFEFGQGGPGGWWFLDEPELHFERNVLVPDLAGWRRERMLEPPDVPWLTLAPDWVCEILSPSTQALDLGRKLPLYYREGISHAWIIDPARYTLDVFNRGEGHWVRSRAYAGGATVRAEPFDGVPLELSLLWLSKSHGPEKQSSSP